MRNSLQMFRFFSFRIGDALLVGATGVAVAVVGFIEKTPIEKTASGPVLRNNKRDFYPTNSATSATQFSAPAALTVLPPNTPAFGQPVISGIGGLGFEEAIRIDPSNPDRVYTSAPGTLSANMSWIWRSLDSGKTFKWVPEAKPLIGKVTTCGGGGDTEILVDDM